jgi:hypothetical protein
MGSGACTRSSHSVSHSINPNDRLTPVTPTLSPSGRTPSESRVPTCAALDEIIRSSLIEYNRGEAFFEALDAQICDTDITACLLPYLRADTALIVTGTFGEFFSRTYSAVFSRIHLVAGALRFGATSPVLPHGHELIDRDVIVLDDSLYSGKTYSCVSVAARRCGARSVRALVAYDGSPEYREDVSSLFRYHSEQLEVLLASGESGIGRTARSS